MSPLRLRRYESADAETVWQLHNAGLDQMGANLGNGPWDDDLRAVADVYVGQGEFLIGEVDGEVVGMGGLRRIDDRRGELKRLRVEERFQGRGFGEKIARALEERARELGYTAIQLDTTDRQVPAQRLAEKLGYRSVRRKRIRGLEVIFYEKRLSSTTKLD